VVKSIGVAATALSTLGLLASDLKMTSQIPNASHALGEPVLVSITFSNAGNVPASVTKDLGLERGGLRFLLSRDGGHFEELHPLAERDPSGQSIEIPPGGKVIHDELLHHQTPTRKVPLFDTPGQYTLQIRSRQATNNVEVKVVAPTGARELRGSEVMRSRAVLELIGLGKVSERAIQDLNQCIAERSQFGPYAALFLSAIAKTKQDSLGLLDRADVSGFSLRSRVVLEKAKLELELGHTEKARELIERLLREFPDSGAAYAPETARILAFTSAPPQATDPLMQAQKELEALRYDVRGLLTNTAPWAREYKLRSLNYYDLNAAGEITMEEARRRDGELLKQYFKANTKPLSPAEWKRRYEGYGREVNERLGK
jgi:hypothetical protein